MSDHDHVLEIAGVDPLSVVPEESTDRGIAFYVVSGTTALDAWRALRAAGPERGFWPVLIGGRDSLDVHRQALRDPRTPPPRTILEQASDLDVRAFLQSRLSERAEDGDLPRGPWPDDFQPAHEIQVHTETASKKPRRQVILALVPTVDAWAVPAFIPLGGWNECPGPEEHVGVLRYWHRSFGAELVGLERDTIECIVNRPPREQGLAVELPEQQYAYAPDIVDQGIETIEALGSVLLDGTAWFFWWD